VARQQPIIRNERAEKQAAIETIRRISDVLAIPTERLAPAAKILTVVTLLEAHSRSSRSQGKRLATSPKPPSVLRPSRWSTTVRLPDRPIIRLESTIVSA
jgi:hypothetical protein